jgi:type III pantothenate kinase
MRLKSMQENTAALPLVKIDLNYNQLVGENTNQSLLSGALIGTVCEIEQMIARYKLNYENLQVVLTGGDADYLSKQLKNRFFTNPIIIIQGLNNILNYNIEKQN